MKRIISLLICILTIFTLCVPSALAADSVGVTFKLDNDKYAVTVSGTYSQDGSVLIVVKDDGGSTVAFEQCDVKNGIFSKSFNMNIPTASGVDYLQYTAYLGHSVLDVQLNVAFNLPTAEFYGNAVKRLKEATDNATIISIITESGELLGLDKTYFTAQAQNAVATRFVGSDRQTLTDETLPALFDECVIKTYIYDLKTDVENVIKHYESTLSIVNGENSMFTEYSAMSTESKAVVLELLSKNEVEDLDNIKDIFNMSVVSETFASGTNSAISTLISNHKTYLGAEGYTGLNATKQVQVISEMKKSAIPMTASEFKALYEKALETVNQPVITPPVSSGGGGGGSAGGGPTGVGQHTTPAEDPIEDNTAKGEETNDAFTDLAGFDWASEAINALVDKGVLHGKSKGIFAPSDFITREEFAKVLSLAYDMYDEGAECIFADVEEGRWSAAYIASIYNESVTSGYPDGTFGCEKYITREELATMLYRVMSNKNKIFTSGDVKTNLKDLNSVSGYAASAVQILEANGIITGDENGLFNPGNNATRAEVCVMVYRAILQMGGETNEK